MAQPNQARPACLTCLEPASGIRTFPTLDFGVPDPSLKLGWAEAGNAKRLQLSSLQHMRAHANRQTGTQSHRIALSMQTHVKKKRDNNATRTHTHTNKHTHTQTHTHTHKHTKKRLQADMVLPNLKVVSRSSGSFDACLIDPECITKVHQIEVRNHTRMFHDEVVGRLPTLRKQECQSNLVLMLCFACTPSSGKH